VLSGRGLCDELITRPEESYRLWCVVVCDLETSRMRRPWLALGRSAPPPSKKISYWNAGSYGGLDLWLLCRWEGKCKGILVEKCLIKVRLTLPKWDDNINSDTVEIECENYMWYVNYLQYWTLISRLLGPAYCPT
jgi:hypothetical protein